MRTKSLHIAMLIAAVAFVTPRLAVSQTAEKAGEHKHDTDDSHAGHEHAQHAGHEHAKKAGDEHAKHADTHQQMQQPTPEQMEEMMKAMMPGEHHKHLDAFVGKWDTVSKIYMSGPDGPAMESPGTTEVKWVLGGRYLQETHHGMMTGMPYEGIGMTGYDNYKNLYVGTWYSNMGTEVLTFKGARDPSGKKFTYYGEMDEPMLNVSGRTVKYVTTITDADHHTLEIIDLHAGDDYKVIEIVYTRQKTEK